MGGKNSSLPSPAEDDVDLNGERTGVYIEKENIPHFKIVLIGDPCVGKSSIFLRYIKNQFNFEYRKTRKVVVENVIKTVNIPQKSISSVTLWDLPGSEDMDLRTSYFRNADAAIVVVDMNDHDSIELAGAWKQDFLNKATRAKFVTTQSKSNGGLISNLKEEPCDPKSIPVLLVGNKYDLVEERVRANKLKKSLQFDLSKAPNNEVDLETNIAQLEKELRLGDLPESTEHNSLTNRPFSSLRGPNKDEERPECVQLLEETADLHGFIGNVMVSAKDGDGSADDAIQSLVRFLLTKHLPPKKKKEKEAGHKMDVSKQLEYKPLRESGKEELDKIFERCYLPLKRSGDYKAYYNLVLKRFKQSCADNGVIETGNPSLEDCILGIRELLQALGNLQLTMHEHEGFVLLDTSDDPNHQIPEEVEIVLGVFNNEYSMVCQSVRRDCPMIDAMLNKFDGKITDHCANLKERYPLDPAETLKDIVDVCENNRARIAFARKEIQELVDTVQKCRDKIEASLMW